MDYYVSSFMVSAAKVDSLVPFVGETSTSWSTVVWSSRVAGELHCHVEIASIMTRVGEEPLVKGKAAPDEGRKSTEYRAPGDPSSKKKELVVPLDA